MVSYLNCSVCLRLNKEAPRLYMPLNSRNHLKTLLYLDLGKVFGRMYVCRMKEKNISPDQRVTCYSLISLTTYDSESGLSDKIFIMIGLIWKIYLVLEFHYADT